MMKREASRRTKSSGAAMIEFALTSLVFLLLLIEIVDFALLFYTMVTLQHAASEGARYGVTGFVESGLDRRASIRQVIEEAAVVPFGGRELDIRIEQAIGIGGTPMADMAVSGSVGEQATLSIRVSYPYRPIILRVVGVSIDLHGRAFMRNENFPAIPPPAP